jgi:hypothetical protein
MASARWPLSAGTGASSSHATDMYFARGPSWPRKSRTPFARIRRFWTGRSSASARTESRDFYRLMFRREWPIFYAFDVLAIDREDLRVLPCHSVSAGSERSCRLLSVGCSPCCRFPRAAAISFGSRAIRTSRELSRSGPAARIKRTAQSLPVRRGSRSRTRATPRPKGGASCSSSDAKERPGVDRPEHRRSDSRRSPVVADRVFFPPMAIQVLQRPDWHGSPVELGEVFILKKNRRQAVCKLRSHEFGWELRVFIGAQSDKRPDPSGPVAGRDVDDWRAVRGEHGRKGLHD